MTGQDAVTVAEEFNNRLDITGVILTKLDGTSKGAIVISVAKEFNLPVKLVGVGEKLEDIREFSPKEFTENLF